MNQRTRKPIVALTLGDPCGIGPEIVLKALISGRPQRICRPLVVGERHSLSRIATELHLRAPIHGCRSLEEAAFAPDRIELFEVPGTSLAASALTWGKPSPQAAEAAREWVRQAALLCLSGRISAMVTGPINKAALQKIGFSFPGHTEFLAHLSGSKEYGMMFLGKGIKIMLVTIHESLRSVPSLLTVEKVAAAIRLTHDGLRSRFGVDHPKIGVAALNPHAGEEGLFGDEEERILIPAIRNANETGTRTTGPIAADTLFRELKEGKFDAAVALYHDQALIPLKLLAFGRAVNVTVGLPFVRTSVDHGTAYDISGKGVADPGSLIEAVRVAVQMIQGSKKAAPGG